MVKKFLLLIFLTASTLFCFGQKKITIENIWDDGLFYPRGVSGYTAMPISDCYTVVKRAGIERYSFATGEKMDLLLDNQILDSLSNGNVNIRRVGSYEFSADERKVILAVDQESVWRRSTLAHYYVYDLNKKTLQVVADTITKLNFAVLSEDGQKVMYAQKCNLFIQDLMTGKITQITNDGQDNAIRNGYADWVYEEELDMSRAASWSPDGSKIAFLRFDESRVKEYDFSIYDGLYPTNFKYKYPKAGEDNSLVDVYVYDLLTQQLTKLDLGDNTNCYFPRVYWLPNSKDVVVLKLNRHQNQLDFIRYNTQTRQQNIVYTDKNDKWLDVTGDYYFLKDNKTMLVSSARDGYNHIYKVTMGGSVSQLTSGKWEVTGIQYVNEAKQQIFYLSNESATLNCDLYVIDFNGQKKKMLSSGDGWNTTEFSPNGNFYRNEYSNLNTLPIYTIHDSKGKELRVLNDNKHVKQNMDEYGFVNRELFTFTTDEGVALNGWIMKPADFNPSKKYPVFMYCYGGPGSQEVMNAYFRAQDLAFYQLLVQHGYICVCVDGRGTANRGDAFKKIVYKDMGHYETLDQIATARYLKTLPYVDSTRVGIWGWSFGGYLSALSMFRGNGMFKMAISVAPVTNWRYYDNIYTERFLQTPQENPDGYDKNSPTTYASQLHGKYLLIHGTADDNVHFQNSMELVKALNEAGVEYDQFFFPNKNHFIMGGNTRKYLYNKLAKYILENL